MRADGRTLILGATKGLGKALADQLAERGRKTIEVGRSVTQDNWKSSRARVGCDLADPESISRLICELEDVKVDHLVWAAGIRKPGLQLSHLQFQVNVTGPMDLVQWFWECTQHDNGEQHSLCVVSSTSADRARDQEPIYAATKAAQAHLARSLAAQERRHMLVTLFKPGGMRTSFWDGQRPDDLTYRRFMDPTKVAALMVELMDEQMEEGELFREILIDRLDHPELV